jgi:hypothetical protein
MTHDYHFVSNVVALPTVVFEVRLKDDSGKVLKTLKYPDEKANFWVRHRQRLLAQGLGNDLPVQRPQGQQLLPPGQTHPKIRLWKPTEGDPVLRLEEVSTLELPDMPLARPSDWAVVLAQSYARFLCRQHGAAKAEVVRKSRNALVPDLMFVVGPNQPLPPDTFAELSCNFGEYRP